MASLYKLPLYAGNETEYEDIVYSFFRKMGEEYNFLFKVKKTNTEIDTILRSRQGTRGEGSCDGYMFTDIKEDQKDSFIGFIELESNGKIQTGMNQIQQYSKSIKDEWTKVFDKNQYFLAIVYDGTRLFISREYKDKSEKVLNEDIRINHVQFTKKLIDEITSLIPKGYELNYEDNEQRLIKSFKGKIRNRGGEIKKYRSELMTVLASLYSITHKSKLSEALDEIKESQNEIDKKIYESWHTIKGKIEYERKRSLIEELYKEIAIPMSLIATAKDIDLYGYFYEELSEKENKQEGGEFYTPRHIIKPVIRYIFNNILKYSRENIKQKKVGDIFIGSGGFLYEYLKYLYKKYNLTEEEMNEIAEKSCYGADNLGIESAQLNMYLVGNGNVNLSEVKTSINWRKAYILAKDDLKNDKLGYRQSLNFFIRIYLNQTQLDILKGKRLLNERYELTDQAITKILEKEQNRYKYENFDEFLKDNLDIGEDEKAYSIFGDLDLLFTNIPYGPIKNEEGKKYWVYDDYPARLESNSLRDCIDILRPKTENEMGGVGIIIVPSGILETNENVYVRRYLIKNCEILGIISLPKYTFAPYTTQKTYMLIIQKKSEMEIRYFDVEKSEQKDETFIYISDVDGKAQSDKRYEVNLTEESNFGEEWLHNDFKENFGKYDGNYISKIERCWDLFKINQNLDYNQERITAKWNGKEWEKNAGKKWGGFKIKSVKKIFLKEKTIKESALKSIQKFIEDKKLSIDDFVSDIKNLDDLKDYKIESKNKEKLLLSASDFELIKNNFNTLFVKDREEDSSKKSKTIAYYEKREIYDFNMSPEIYLSVKVKEDLTIEDIRLQLKEV